MTAADAGIAEAVERVRVALECSAEDFDCENGVHRIATADLRLLLSRLDAGRGDAERLTDDATIERVAEQLYWFDESYHGHEPAKSWENVGSVWQDGWRRRAKTILARVSAAARSGVRG